jgi:hypothetical protein
MINNHMFGGTERTLSQLSIVDQELSFEYEYAFLFPSGHVYHASGGEGQTSALTLANALRSLGYVVYPIAGERREQVILHGDCISITTFVTVLVVPECTHHS